MPLHKSYSGTFNVRLTPQLHAQAVMRSSELGISLNAFIKSIIKKAML